MSNNGGPIRAIPPGFETDDDTNETTPTLGRLREVIQVVSFKAFYMQLAKQAAGDYRLTLGVPHNQKDLAWKLSDYDGRMLEIQVSVLKRVPQ